GAPPPPVGVSAPLLGRPRPPRTAAIHGPPPRPASRSRLLRRDDVPRLPRPRRTHLRLRVVADESQLQRGGGLGPRRDARADDSRRRVPVSARTRRAAPDRRPSARRQRV